MNIRIHHILKGALSIALVVGLFSVAQPTHAQQLPSNLFGGSSFNFGGGSGINLGSLGSGGGIPSGFSNSPGTSFGTQACQAMGNNLGGIVGNILSGIASSLLSDSSGDSGGQTINWETEFVSASTLGTSNGWTNPNNAFISDNVYATASSFLSSQDYDGFEFMLPNNATIRGIEVSLEASASAPGGTISVEISGNNTNTITTTNNQTGTLSTTDTSFTFGGSSDLWGRGWDVDDMSRSNFRVRLLARPASNTVRADVVRVKVYYQTTEATQSGSLGSGGNSGFGGAGNNLLGGVGQQALGGLLQGQGFDQIVQGIAGNIFGGTGGVGSIGSIVGGNFPALPSTGPVVPVRDDRHIAVTKDQLVPTQIKALEQLVTGVHKECVLDKAASSARTLMLDRINADAITWANEVKENGETKAFVTNLYQYYNDVEKENVEAKTEELLEAVDPSIREDVKKAVQANQLSAERRLQVDWNNKCPVEAFKAGQPTGEAGWDCFYLFATQPGATIEGARIIVESEVARDTEVVKVAKRDEVVGIGEGFYPKQKCPDGKRYVSKECVTETPGSVLQDQLVGVFDASLQNTVNIDEPTDLVESLLFQLINKLFSTGLSGLSKASSGGGSSGSFADQLRSGQSTFNDLSNTFSQTAVTPILGGITDSTGPSTTEEDVLYAALFHIYPERTHSGVTLLSTLTTSINPQTIDSTLSGGLGLLTDVARGKDNEHRLLYRETAGSPSWSYLGEGGQLSNVPWSEITTALNSSAQNIALVYTNPRKESCELAPPSISDLATVGYARADLLTSINTAIDFIAVDSKGWWTFDVPALWTTNLFDTQTKNLATNLLTITEFKNALSTIPPATDPREHLKDVFAKTLNGEYGSEARTLAAQIEANIVTNPVDVLADAEKDLVQTPCTLTTQRQSRADSYINEMQTTGVFIERTNR